MKLAVANLVALTLAMTCGSLSLAAEGGSESSQWAQGKAVYEHWCVACHGTGEGFGGLLLPGTEALMVKYGDQLPAVLHERQDLTPELVTLFVRNGVSIMPFFRKTEISDEELAALGVYLSKPSQAAASSGASDHD